MLSLLLQLTRLHGFFTIGSQDSHDFCLYEQQTIDTGGSARHSIYEKTKTGSPDYVFAE